MATNTSPPLIEFEGYLQKKCVLIYWFKGKPEAREAVPKVWKYVTRYFFVIGNTLCYTKTKRDQEQRKKYRIILTLSHIKDVTFTHKKITIVTDSSQKVVLKGTAENITGWVAFLVPFRDSAIKPTNDFIVPKPRTFPKRRETLTKYPGPASISAPNLPLPSTPTFPHPPPPGHHSLSSLQQRKAPSNSSSISSNGSSNASSPTTTPRSDALIDDRVPWRENATLRPYKPHEHSETYIPIHAEKLGLNRIRSSSKSPCTSSGSLVSSWSMNNIAEWDEPDSGVSGDAQAMSWDEWDAIFIKSQSLENVSYLSNVA